MQFPIAWLQVCMQITMGHKEERIKRVGTGDVCTSLDSLSLSSSDVVTGLAEGQTSTEIHWKLLGKEETCVCAVSVGKVRNFCL